MEKPVEWHLWSAERIVEALPDLIERVEARLSEFPEDHREKNQAAVASLRERPPTPAEVREGVRSRELVTLGFALDVLGRRTAGDGRVEDSLLLFQAAHEMFRAGNPLLRATRPMRQTLGNALKVLLLDDVGRARRGETTAGAIRERLQGFVGSAWGFVPPQLGLSANEMLLQELERARIAGEGDEAFQERLVRDNLEAVLSMETPSRLEPIRRRWEELGERIAPEVVRHAQRGVRRPEALSLLLPATVWAEIQGAVERGDVEGLGQALADVEDALETNLRLRLDAKPEYREPTAELRLAGGVDPAFVEARTLLLQRDPLALDRFNTIHYRRSHNPIAKEWYAYALTVFGRATDIHDIIELLEDAIASEHHRQDRGWTARWNLACALRRLPSRATDALDVLLPVLEMDAHTSEVFELCLLWGLEQNRQDLLGSLLLRAPHYEAHLLAALRDADASREGHGGATAFREHFRRINRLLRDPDRVFPDPKERLTFDELDRLTREFIESSLVAAGVEWFRQRVAYGIEGRVFKNWECAAALNEAAADLRAAWRCRLASWRSTQHKKNVDPRKKAAVLRALLGWAQRRGFDAEGLKVLRQSWRDTSMTDADARLWEERLSRLPGGPGESPEAPGDAMAPLEAPDGDARLASPGDEADTGSPTTRPWRERRRAPDPHAARRQLLALLLDWENIKISLADVLAQMPEARAQALRPRLGGAELAARLLDAAARHGIARQRWAVADWDRPFFEGDQKAVKAARFWPDIAGGDKVNSSDHVLREKIHHVLREYPDVGVYVIGTGDGDFLEAIRTLQQQGKQVILWATRRSINQVFGESLRGPDRIQIEWLEDLVFGDAAAD